MSIAALTAVSSPPVAPVYVTATNAAAAIDSGLTALNPLKATEASVVDSRDTVVQFSSLAQLLEATLAFDQTQGAASKAVDALNAPGRGTISTVFSQFFGTAQAFVDAFNNFQTSSANSLDTPFGSAFDNALLLAIHAQSGTSNGISLIDNLATIGINFQEPSATTDTGKFSIDLNSLQAAFNLDPVKTSEVLTQSLQTLAGIEAKLISLPSLQSSSLFTSDLGGTFSTSLPGSPFDTSTVTGLLDQLSSEDALKVNIALKQLMEDEALVTALGANPSAAATVAGAVGSDVNTTASAVRGSAGAANPATGTGAGETPSNAVLAELTSNNLAGAAIASSPRNTATTAAIVSPAVLAANLVATPSATPSGSPAQQLPGLAQTPARTDLNTLNNAISASQKQNALANSNSLSGSITQAGTISSTRASYLPLETDAVKSAALATNASVRVLAAGINVSPASLASTNAAPIVTINSAVNLAAVPNVNVAVNAVNTSAVDTGVRVSAARNDMPVPFAALNPYLAAAVAAYRVNEALGRVPSYELVPRVSETVPGVAAVGRVSPVTLDAHEGANDSRSKQTRRGGAGARISLEPEPIGAVLPVALTRVDVSA